METLHTTGDWYAKDGQIVAQDTGKTLALIPYYDASNEEQTANANLMAAAPELLEAAKLAFEAIDAYVLSGEVMRGTIAENRLRQAIQKAMNP